MPKPTQPPRRPDRQARVYKNMKVRTSITKNQLNLKEQQLAHKHILSIGWKTTGNFVDVII